MNNKKYFGWRVGIKNTIFFAQRLFTELSYPDNGLGCVTHNSVQSTVYDRKSNKPLKFVARASSIVFYECKTSYFAAHLDHHRLLGRQGAHQWTSSMRTIVLEHFGYT